MEENVTEKLSEQKQSDVFAQYGSDSKPLKVSNAPLVADYAPHVSRLVVVELRVAWDHAYILLLLTYALSTVWKSIK